MRESLSSARLMGCLGSLQSLVVLQSKRLCTISHDDRRGALEARRRPARRVVSATCSDTSRDMNTSPPSGNTPASGSVICAPPIATRAAGAWRTRTRRRFIASASVHASFPRMVFGQHDKTAAFHMPRERSSRKPATPASVPPCTHLQTIRNGSRRTIPTCQRFSGKLPYRPSQEQAAVPFPMSVGGREGGVTGLGRHPDRGPYRTDLHTRP